MNLFLTLFAFLTIPNDQKMFWWARSKFFYVNNSWCLEVTKQKLSFELDLQMDMNKESLRGGEGRTLYLR